MGRGPKKLLQKLTGAPKLRESSAEPVSKPDIKTTKPPRVATEELYLCQICKRGYPIEFFSKYVQNHQESLGHALCNSCWAKMTGSQTKPCSECKKEGSLSEFAARGKGVTCLECQKTRESRYEQEVKALTKDPEMQKSYIKYAKKLIEISSKRPLSHRERKAIDRARELVAQRGWKQGHIDVFILDHVQGGELNDRQATREEWNRRTSSSLGPAGVFIAWNAHNQDLSEEGLARLIVHEMVHSRSHAISDGFPSALFDDEETKPRNGLFQIMEGITEIIAEDILPAPEDFKRPAPTINTEVSREFFEENGISLSDLEKLSQDDAIYLLAERMGVDIDTLDDIYMKRLLPRQREAGLDV